MLRPRGCGGGFIIAILGHSAMVEGAPRAIVTAQAGIAGCLGSEELASRLESAFADAEGPPSDQTLHVSVSRRARGGLVADVRWVGARETPRRSLESASDDCHQLDDAVPLVARALWEAEVAPTESPAAAPKETAASTPTPAPASSLSLAGPAPSFIGIPRTSRDAKPSSRAKEGPRVPLQLALGVVGALGVLEQTALGVRADVRVPVAQTLALRFAITHWDDGRVAKVDGGRARFRAIMGRAAGCWAVAATVSLDACLGVEAGVLVPQLSQVARADEDARLLLWPLALVAGRVQLVGPVVAQGAVAAGPTLVRRDYFLLDAQGERQTVLRAAPAMMEAGLSLGVELP